MNNKNQFQSNQRYFTICIYTVFVILAACIIFRIIFHWDSTIQIFRNLLSNMSSFVVGILIAFMVNPLAVYIQDKILINACHLKNKKLCKFLSILTTYIIILGFIGICLVYIIPQLISSISELSANIPLMYITFSRWLRDFAYENDFINNNLINQFINKLSPKMMELSTALASKLIPWLYSASIAIIKWFIMIIIAIVVSIYLLSDKKIIFHNIRKLLFAFFQNDLRKEPLKLHQIVIKFLPVIS